MADPVGGATVRISPDLSYFEEELRSQLAATMGDSGEPVKITPDLDESKVKADLDALRAQVEAGGSTIHFTANLDDARAMQTAADLKVALDEIGGTVTATAALDDTVGKAELDDFNRDLTDFGLKHETARVSIDTGDSGPKILALDAAIDQLIFKLDLLGEGLNGPNGPGKGLDNTTRAAGDAAGGLGALATTAIALGPALVPIGAELAAGILGILPVLTAAGLGLGAFAVAAEGDLGKVENVAKETLTAFQKLAAPDVMPVIAKSIGLIGPAFAAIMPLVDSTATELGKLEDAARSAFTAPFWQGFITFLGAEAGPAINSITTFLGGFVKGFAGFAQVFEPIISDIEGGLEGIGNRIATFGQGLSSSTGFQSFIDYVVREAPVVGQFFTNLSADVEHLLIDLAPLGAVVLQVLTSLTGFLNVVEQIHGPLGLNAVDIGLAVFAYAKLSGPIGDAISALGKFRLATLAVNDAGVASAGGLAGLVGSLGGIGPAALLAAPLIAGIGVAFWQSGNQAATAKAQVDAFLGDLLSESATTLPQLEAKLDDLKAKLADLGPATAAGKLGLQGWINAQNDLKGAIASTETQQRDYNSNLSILTGNLGLSKSSVESMATSLNIDLTKSLNPAQVRQFSAALQEQETQTGLTGAALTSLAATANVTTGQIATAVGDTVKAATNSWASFGNAVTAFATSTLPVTGSQIAAFYTTQATEGAQFSANIQKAIADGYNPQLISQILQAGPAQASQLLQGLVNAQGTGLNKLITQATAAMSAEGVQAIQEARLTQEAVSANSSAMTAQLGTALSISQALTTSNVEASVAAIAGKLSGGLPQVIAIAKEYGIALPNGLTASIADAGAAAAAQASGVTSAIGQGLPAVTGAAAALAGATPKAITTAIPDVQTAANATTTAFLAIYHSHLPDATSAGADLNTAVGKGVGGVDLSPAGAASLKSIIAGLTENGGFLTPKGQAAAMVTAVKNEIASLGGELAPAGLSIAEGVASGMTSFNALSALTAGAIHMVDVAKAAANAAAQSHSPSKLFADEVGLPLAQGIAQGMSSTVATQAIGDAAVTIITSALAGLTDAGQIHSPSALTSTTIGVPIAQGIAAGISSPASTNALTTAATGAVQAVSAGLTSGTPDATSAADAVIAAALAEFTNADSQFQTAGASNAAAYAAGLGAGATGATAGSGAAGAPAPTDPQTLASQLAQAYAGIAQQAGGASSATGAYGNQPVSAQLAQLQSAALAVTDAQSKLASALAGQKAQNAQDITDAAGGPETAADVLVDKQVAQMVSVAQDQAAKAMQSFTVVGAAIAQGISAGLNGATGAPIDAAQTLINNLIAAMQAAAQIHSPSERAAREIGVPIAQGIASGMASELGNTSTTARSLVSGIFDHIPSGVNHGGPAGGYSPTYNVNIHGGSGDDIATTFRRMLDEHDREALLLWSARG